MLEECLLLYDTLQGIGRGCTFLSRNSACALIGRAGKRGNGTKKRVASLLVCKQTSHMWKATRTQESAHIHLTVRSMFGIRGDCRMLIRGWKGFSRCSWKAVLLSTVCWKQSKSRMRRQRQQMQGREVAAVPSQVDYDVNLMMRPAETCK